MAKRGGDERAINGHLWDARSEVVAVLVLVMGNPGCEEFLQTSECARRQHLGAHRVGLKLLEISLQRAIAPFVSIPRLV